MAKVITLCKIMLKVKKKVDKKDVGGLDQSTDQQTITQEDVKLVLISTSITTGITRNVFLHLIQTWLVIMKGFIM